MAASTPSLNNLDELMAAAIAQSQALSQPASSNEPAPTPAFEPGTSGSLPDLSMVKTSEDIKAALAGSGLKTALTKMAQNPDEIAKMMGSQLKNAPPEVMEQARKLAMGGQGEHIMKEMKKKGMDPLAMRAQIKQHKKAAKGSTPAVTEPTLAAIHINVGRKAKVVNVSRVSVGSSVASILHVPKPVEMSCSRLACGPLADKVIKVWYNPDTTGKNRRTSKIVGFPIGSDVVIVAVDDNLTIAELERVEQLLL
jgi:hypothetical protein